MPLFDIKCTKCEFSEERLLFHNEETFVCKNCGAVAVKQISAFMPIFKGSCWYNDGYSKRDS